ncbi:MAG: Ig domain-containing protein [bacterium]|nr:Ig domain-containing protein [bacterium]
MKTNINRNQKAIAVAIFALALVIAFSPLSLVNTANAGFTQCSDGINNDPLQDDLIDADDPGCHTDFNANNASTYDPTLNSEINPSSSGSNGGGSTGGCFFGCGSPDPDPDPVPPPVNTLRVSCEVSETRIDAGDRVTYEVEISGGRAPYDIEWEGDHRDVDGEDDDRFSVRYDREGRFEAEVTVRDANGNRDSDQCRDVRVEKEDIFIPSPSNRAPVITSVAPTTANTGVTYIYDVNAFDPDGDSIFYSLSSGPAGLTINPSTGLIQWLPSFAQGNQSHFVSVVASDGRATATQSFSIFVNRPVVVQPPVVVTPRPVPVAKLEILSLRVDNDAQNNAIVSFETNIPASGSVAYSLTSHADDRNANNYENRVNGFSQTTLHQVNLGQLEINRTYYLRALASTSNDSDITAELAFIQLPSGIVQGTDTELILEETATMTLGSAFAILFGWLFSPWLLFLIIIILLILILLRGRDKDTTIITQGQGPTVQS